MRTASSDPATIEALLEYADVLVEESGWPIVFDFYFVITSSPGGINLCFRPDYNTFGDLEASRRVDAYRSLSQEEKKARWQEIFCRPELPALIEQHGLFGAGVSEIPGVVRMSTTAALYLAEDDLELLRRFASVRRTLYGFQWEYSRFSRGEIESLPVAGYRQSAAGMGLTDVWPFIENDVEFESAFRDWLEEQVLGF